MDDHVKATHEKDITQYNCSICNKTFKIKNQLNRHEKLHVLNETKQHECSRCRKCFASDETLNIHKDGCHSEKLSKISCPVCSKEILKSNMKAHLKHRHYDMTKDFKCECNKTFHTEQILRSHRKTHLGGPSFRCSQCDKSYRGSSGLARHVLVIHNENYSFPCHACSQVFKDPVILKRHKNIHTGEMPFKCIDCDKAFNTPSGLYVHRNIHTKEKRYKCTQCTDAFREKRQLGIHISKHTGEMPYICDICNTGKSSSRQLRRHKKENTTLDV